jgi:hypothetical protein
MKKEVINKPEHLKHRKAKKFLCFFSIILLSIIIISECTGNNIPANKVDSTNSINKKHKKEVENWSYTSDVDKMTSQEISFATCESINTADFKFPYDGGSSFQLTIRKESNKRYVTLSVSKGQFVGNYNSNIRVKFDNNKVENYNYVEPNDGSSDVIFINNESKFINKLKKATILKIEAEFYQEGRIVIEFNVAGLKMS